MVNKLIFAMICLFLGATTVLAGFLPLGDQYAYPRYNYRYAVNDPITGDRKTVGEIRDGPYVAGGYAVAQPYSAREVNYEFNGGRFGRPVPILAPGPIFFP